MAIVEKTPGGARVAAGTEKTLTPGEVFRGTVGPFNNSDRMHVELASGTMYDLSQISGEEITLSIFDSKRNNLVIDECFVPGAKLLFAARVAGTHSISICAGGNVLNKYELLLTENPMPMGIYDERADYLTDGWWQCYFDRQGYLMLSPG